MVYMFLADGFEELEAIAPLDVLRRAGIQVYTVAAQDSLTVTSSHSIPVKADIGYKDADPKGLEMVILPGGLGGVKNMAKCPAVEKTVRYCAEQGILIGAICAAPSLLGDWGLLKDVRATCYPGFEDRLTGYIPTKDYIVSDGIYITAKGAGVALDFGLELVLRLKGKDEADKIAGAIQCL